MPVTAKLQFDGLLICLLAGQVDGESLQVPAGDEARRCFAIDPVSYFLFPHLAGMINSSLRLVVGVLGEWIHLLFVFHKPSVRCPSQH
jgi:hypothetical protein